MQQNIVGRIVKYVILGILALVLFGLVVMALWNWLMPALFGLRIIGFWQALGLVVLCKILFGGLHSHGRHGHWRGRMKDRWEQMTPEEREKFRHGMWGHWCPPGPAAEPKP
jgi:hypothetical protein